MLTKFQTVLMGLIIIFLGCGIVTHQLAGTIEATLQNQSEMIEILERSK